MAEGAKEDTITLDPQWEAAIGRVDSVIAKYNPSKHTDELRQLQEGTKGVIHDLAESTSIKYVVTAVDGREIRTVEPETSETHGFGIPVREFKEIMGISRDWEHLDPKTELPHAIADASNKPVSALINGEYVSLVQPSATATVNVS